MGLRLQLEFSTGRSHRTNELSRLERKCFLCKETESFSLDSACFDVRRSCVGS